MKSRRGISSVVGTVFAIIALSTTVGYITYSMTILDQYNGAVITRSQAATDSVKEKFQVSSVTYANNKLNITITNTGSLPVNFTKVWTTDNSVTPIAVKNSIPVNKLATPGATLVNLGQDGPTALNSAHSYHVKLVTSRGNTNEFDVNSVSSSPVNIQLISNPSTIASGFKSQLIMTVTNNQSGTLTNLVPNISLNPGYTTTSCAIDPVTPSSYNTLPPGGTAVFTTGVKVIGTTDGQSCTLKAQLTNGYAKNNANSTIVMTSISLSSTTYSQSAGVLTLNYTTFRWAATGQGGTWNKGFSFPHGQTAAFKLDMTNNNSTGKLWIAKKSTLLFYSTHISPSQQPTAFYIVNSTNPSTMNSIKYGTCNGQQDYCLSIPPLGTVTLYFAAATQGNNDAQSFSNADINTCFLLVFGKYTATQTGTGPEYAQNTPYIAADIT